MRVPLRWLREYVDFPQSADEIARLLTMSGTEVGTISRVGTGWDRIVIGRVAEIKRHEAADHLFVAQVDVGSEMLTLVTAAPNLSAGDVVPVVRAGGRLGSDRVLEARRFRGVLSQGMMCSGDELGVSPDKEHIYQLEPEAPIGEDLYAFLGDEILDIELTPNRADCLGIVGIAREVAALTGRQLRMPATDFQTGAFAVEDRVHVFVDDPDLCPRYTAGYIEKVRIAPSPQWMQRRLHAVGVRAISNVVDVTNYVMLELGQPLHAFDADGLGENTIRVRRARPGEHLTTLDGVDRELPPDALVIADAHIAVGLAGIMGGENSEISATSSQIVLESATFDRANIRRTTRALRLATEASKRFDKGLDQELAPLASRRALALMADLAGGTPARGMLDVRASVPEPRTIRFSVGDISGLIGQEYSTAEIERVLQPLGFDVTANGDRLDAVVPTWRADVEGRADVAEEVARISGYDAIPVALPSGSLPRAAEDPVIRREDTVRAALAAAGLQEVKTYSLVDPFAVGKLNGDAPPPSEPDTATIPVFNPMSVEQSRLRTTLLPSLVTTVAENLRFQERVLIFELARVYLPPLDPLPREARRLGIAMAGRRSPAGWNREPATVDFYDLKAAVEVAFGSLHLPAPEVQATGGGWLHPGRGASVHATPGAAAFGLMGQVHPRVVERFGIDTVEVYAAELDLDALLGAARDEIAVQPLPRFPAVTRDLALLVADAIIHEELRHAMHRAGGPLLEDVRLFDVYRGEGIPEGHRSLAFSLTFRAPDRTLTEDEISVVMRGVEAAVTSQFDAHIRGR